MKFGTVINCMDGRVQIPVIEWIKNNFDVEYVDVITEPGPDKILATSTDDLILRRLQSKAEISVKVHRSKLIAVVGHFDCAGNPVTEEEHKLQIIESVKKIKSWDFDTEILGLWVNENWVVHRIV